MSFFRKLIVPLAAIAMTLSSGMASAADVIAHRGVFHDVNGPESLPENSYFAILRAYELGMKGAEIDLRLDANGTVIVTHDLISNRTTDRDNAGGGMNAVDVALNLQSAPNALWFNATYPSEWQRANLKIYGRNGALVKRNDYFSFIVSLETMLGGLRTNRSDIINSNFKIILDIQDFRILKSAAETVKKLGLTRNVYLKFFASKALGAGYTYSGPETCYTYAKNNSLLGTNIIPQINDGELDIYDNNDAGIYAFGRTLPIDTYLQCWADAQNRHNDAPKMPIVSASVPAEDWNKTAGAFRAIYWAQNHGRETMTIIPNPDAGRVISGSCRLFSFQSAKVGAMSFNNDARQAKANFAANSSVRPDYIIWDVMGDIRTKRWTTEFEQYKKAIC